MAEKGKEEKKEESMVERAGGLFDEDWLYRPLAEMERMFDELERNFGGMFYRPIRRRIRGRSTKRMPLVDIKDVGDNYLLEAELPGLKKEDIEIEVKDDRITLKGETKQEKKEEGEGYLRQERSFRSFYREIPIPENVKAEDAEASFKNGVLEVKLPKVEQKKLEGKKIDIK